MRALGTFLGLIIAVGALSGIVWLGRYSPWGNRPHRERMRWEETDEGQADIKKKTDAHEKKEAAKEKQEAKAGSNVEPRPSIAEKGPYPKLETGERVFEFGKMGVREEKKHKFRMENKGEAPLRIAKGPTNCHCTISNLNKHEVPPGSFAEVEMTWTPDKTDPTFAKTATIYTNDPDQAEIQFKVFGEVVEKFIVEPKDWNAGHITNIQDGATSGILGSGIEKSFKILSIDSSDPHVKVDYEPLTRQQMVRQHIRSGYRFKVKVDRGIPIGRFRSQLRIHTTLEGNKTIEVEVTALRSGPIVFLIPIANTKKTTGVFWNAERTLMNLGRFRHEDGVNVELPAFIYGVKDKFEILDIKTDPDLVKVSVVPRPEITKADQQGVRFVFEVPPGAPPETRVSPEACHVTIKTNHPSLKEIKFEVEFVSQ